MELDERCSFAYNPDLDGDADPGEIVWTWVPYEDDATQGKDRPVVVVGRSGDVLVGLMMSSQDHDRDAAQEAHWGRFWMDIGTGPWDREGRPSEVRLDRVLALPAEDIRREGCILDAERFHLVQTEAARLHNWRLDAAGGPDRR